MTHDARIALLRQIAGSRLPMLLYRSDDIDRVRALRAEGLVVASVPAPSGPFSMSSLANAAEVLAITQKGREALVEFSYPAARSAGLRDRLGPVPAGMAGQGIAREGVALA